jgi:plastocyanin domain-containing protein
LSFAFLAGQARAWDIDMSRRKADFDKISDQNRLPASEKTSSPGFNVEELIPNTQPVQDIVILNTDKGFIPEKVVVRKGEAYKIHLVNVHPEKKNISFIMDDFAESHSTPFALDKEFELHPKKAGEFSFHCPETSFRGRLIVIDTDRKPASK